MRLITRSDFDGLACAALLEELGIVDEIFYSHPKDLQDKKVEVTENDVLANMPFVEGCGLWFDHHSSEHERTQVKGKFEGASELEPSAARVIYNYYSKDKKKSGKLKKFVEMVQTVDKADSAQYTIEDIENPQSWMMLAFIADPRTGLGYKRDFRISNFELMKSLPKLLRTKTIDEILDMPDFKERIEYYYEQTETYKNFIAAHTKIEGDAIVIDFRGETNIPSGNRFLEYTMYPDKNISVRIVDGRNKEFAMISIGHSIINRTSNIDVGSLALKYGGGGHKKVGTCQVDYEKADDVSKEIIDAINAGK